jgi:hypothetical protein
LHFWHLFSSGGGSEFGFPCFTVFIQKRQQRELKFIPMGLLRAVREKAW